MAGGIGPESLFLAKFKVVSEFQGLITDGSSPESEFPSRRITDNWGRLSMPVGISPDNKLLLALKTFIFVQEERPSGIRPENLLSLISNLDNFVATLLGKSTERKFPISLKLERLNNVQIPGGNSPVKLLS
ncbi:hypothetical protein L2E82_06620 [Cichorium intybus]|uniref:Uncharacterized protein n=1 Tax=Cichorium intybus TaxID=13427 RepID=A0ACB9HCR7_CICIN|nr:hypothetical protein L2E82_06620 [Cichorium intybus]